MTESLALTRIRRTSTASIPFGPYTPPRTMKKSPTPMAWFVFKYRNGRQTIGRLNRILYKMPASSDMATLAVKAKELRPRPRSICFEISRATADFARLMALTPTPAPTLTGGAL